MPRRIGEHQIGDGNIGLPDLASFDWTLTSVVSGTMYALQWSGTQISGDKREIWIQDIIRDSSTNLPLQVKDALYNKSDHALRFQKVTTLSRGPLGNVIHTSGSIIGENTD